MGIIYYIKDKLFNGIYLNNKSLKIHVYTHMNKYYVHKKNYITLKSLCINVYNKLLLLRLNKISFLIFKDI